MGTLRQRSPRSAGFTLLESTMAMGVMAVAGLGALAAMGHSGNELQRGQLRQSKAALLLESSQRMMLMAKASPSLTSPGKTLLSAQAKPLPSTSPEKLAIGASPWVPDPSGAYFTLTPDGQIAPRTDVAAGTACSSASLPPGTCCREILVTEGMPVALGANAALVPAGMSPFTLWVRISRAGEPADWAATHREVFVQ